MFERINPSGQLVDPLAIVLGLRRRGLGRTVCGGSCISILLHSCFKRIDTRIHGSNMLIDIVRGGATAKAKAT